MVIFPPSAVRLPDEKRGFASADPLFNVQDYSTGLERI